MAHIPPTTETTQRNRKIKNTKENQGAAHLIKRDTSPPLAGLSCLRSVGESWRIGIDEKHQTALVKTGVFGFSRNPIFLGMMITLAGVFLVIPNVLTLLALVTV